MKATTLRRLLVGLMTLPLLWGAAACGGGFDSGGGGDKVTLVGQGFTEADLMTQMYKQVLDKAGYDTSVKNFKTRDIYLSSLQEGKVQVSADYLSSMTEALNRKANGADAKPVASPDEAATLEELTTLGKKYGLTPLTPAKAEDANAYAVTKKFAEDNKVSTLSELGALKKPIALAANSDCPDRDDCAKGLRSVYGIDLTKVVPLGFGSAETKKALTSGEVQLGQVGTTDGSLAAQGIVILKDDKNWQNAENMVPVVNTKWLKKNAKAEKALDKLSAVLTTEDLTKMNQQVDGERLQASEVAKTYLKGKGLI